MDFITIIIYISIYIGLVATTFYILSFIAGTKKEKFFFNEEELPFVSVIIPAYNEEKTIAKTIESILNSDYPKFEVMVVDDGSKDETLKIAKTYENSQVKVLTKENGGKGTALNLGLKEVKGEIIFTMDADTYVDSKAMKKMVMYFKNPKVMSVSPAMIVSKPKTILQRVQHMEYVLGLFLRKALTSLDAIFVTPGAFSAYRKSFFDKYGGYDEENIVEDLEIALRIQSEGYKTENSPESLAYTNVPDKFMPLLIQRRRWYYGLIKNLWTYRRIFGRKYGDLGLFVLPIAMVGIVLSLIITSYFFIKIFFEVQKNILFLQAINFDFKSMISFSFLALERTLFLFFSNPMVLFVFVFIAFLTFYIIYASRKMGKIAKLYLDLPLFFLFFAIFFGFWWMISIFYALFYKKIKWR
jgi:cellulose synthase/poly-beta-1,6-N-acetylglucosamine synthase-like glycosyltransferase